MAEHARARRSVPTRGRVIEPVRSARPNVLIGNASNEPTRFRARPPLHRLGRPIRAARDLINHVGSRISARVLRIKPDRQAHRGRIEASIPSATSVVPINARVHDPTSAPLHRPPRDLTNDQRHDPIASRNRPASNALVLRHPLAPHLDRQL